MLILLDQLSLPVHEQVIYILWRARHLRNDLIFGKRNDFVSASANFVENYWSSYSSCHSNAHLVPNVEGKGVVAHFENR